MEIQQGSNFLRHGVVLEASTRTCSVCRTNYHAISSMQVSLSYSALEILALASSGRSLHRVLSALEYVLLFCTIA